MRALTVHQPWASLIAVGAKTIETRSWATTYRGPLAIHAGKRPITSADKRDYFGVYPSQATHSGLVHGPVGARVANALDAAGYGHEVADGSDLPLGAVVASCRLIDVVPIITNCGTDIEAPPHVCHAGGAQLLSHRPESAPFADGETEHDATGQLPLGNFAPGGFAWLLSDIAPTRQRCPSCLAMHGDANAEPSCSVCEGDGECEAVPARGKQGLWEWTP